MSARRLVRRMLTRMPVLCPIHLVISSVFPVIVSLRRRMLLAVIGLRRSGTGRRTGRPVVGVSVTRRMAGRRTRLPLLLRRRLSPIIIICLIGPAVVWRMTAATGVAVVIRRIALSIRDPGPAVRWMRMWLRMRMSGVMGRRDTGPVTGKRVGDCGRFATRTGVRVTGQRTGVWGRSGRRSGPGSRLLWLLLLLRRRRLWLLLLLLLWLLLWRRPLVLGIGGYAGVRAGLHLVGKGVLCGQTLTRQRLLLAGSRWRSG